ncbi:hypothetical protein UFOVP1201_5 [uncultured Caudovirales phage]|uniref:Uncharacterized protein n=1 Tax=uncultured Caudovirales phage TaxID=2100421 RepID=A0A6J5NSD0_9CAUD|nr:hypothetical protein UFOVP788_25 [uncultured Caudovirales phage]CAB4189535.1 hypothetical protein UFOVP1201_5 [uncultured Caudovirales phage]
MLITAKDFEALSNTKMQWAGYGWESQSDRFDQELFYEWPWAYWFEDAASMILARMFLFNLGRGFEFAYDEATDNYIIVTNYNSDIKVGA